MSSMLLSWRPAVNKQAIEQISKNINILDTETFTIKRTVYLACLGLDIYMLAIYTTQSALVTGGSFLLDFIPELMPYANLLNGVVAIASVVLGLILLWLYVYEMHEDKLLFGGSKPLAVITEKRKNFGLGKCICFTALMLTLQIAASMLLNLTELILNTFGLTVTESPAMNADYSSSILLLLYMILIGPLIEELVFRGFLLKTLSKCGKVYAIVISALMFSLMHGDIQQLLFTFAAGLILGYVATEYSIRASLILHIINNGVFGGLIAYLSEHLPYNAYIIGMFVLLVAGIIISICLIVRNIAGLKVYVREHPSVPHAYAALKNRWFIAFAACMIYMTLSTIARL